MANKLALLMILISPFASIAGQNGYNDGNFKNANIATPCGCKFCMEHNPEYARNCHSQTASAKGAVPTVEEKFKQTGVTNKAGN